MKTSCSVKQTIFQCVNKPLPNYHTCVRDPATSVQKRENKTHLVCLTGFLLSYRQFAAVTSQKLPPDETASGKPRI